MRVEESSQSGGMNAVLKLRALAVYLSPIFAAGRANLRGIRMAVRSRAARDHDYRLRSAIPTYCPMFTWLGTYQDNPVLWILCPIDAFLVEFFPHAADTPQCPRPITSVMTYLEAECRSSPPGSHRPSKASC
jgi:hypothetical protein